MANDTENKKARLKDWLEYIGARVMLVFFRLLGLPLASAFGGWLGRTIGPPLGVSKRARRNLEHAMPELTDQQRNDIVKGMWENLGRTIAEIAHLQKYNEDARTGANDLVRITGFSELEKARNSGKGVILLSGHFANWEILPLVAGPLRGDLAELYRTPNNPLIDDFLHKLRDAGTPTVQIAKGPNSARQMFRHLRKGKIVGILADQKLREGLKVNFFGQPAYTTHAPMQMAHKFGAIVLPGSIRRVENYKFEVTIYPPLSVPDDPDKSEDDLIAAYTQDMNDWLEAQVRARPEEWFWLHDRWRQYRPRKPKTSS